MNKEYYQSLNDRCKKAISKIENTEIENWLYLSSKLINEVSNKPEGLPSIANAHFKGIHYPFISEFHRLYIQHFNEINKSNL